MFAKAVNASVVSLFALLLLGSCDIGYEPAFEDDAPGSPGSKVYQKFIYKERVEVPLTAEDLSKTMPLTKLFDIALYNNPTTRVSWNAARAAAFGYHVSLSEYYPTILYSGNVQAQLSNGAVNISGAGGAIVGGGAAAASAATGATGPVSATVETAFNEVSLSFLLLDFGGRDAQAELAFQTLVAANWQHNLVMQQVMLSVLTYYTSYIGNKALVVASEQDLKDAKVALESALKMKKAGVATLTDVLSAQSTVEQFRFNLEQARGAEKTTLAELLITLGLEPDTCVSIEELPEKLPVIEISGCLCALIELAKAKRPDIGAAIAQVKEQESDLIVSYSSGLPTLTLNGSCSRVDFLKTPTPALYNDSVALDWSFPIFSGFYYDNQQKQIRAQIDEAIANVDATVAQVVTGVVVNYYAFTTAEAALPSTEALVEYSQRAYRGMLSQYKVGTASITDVLTALTTLSNARAQQVMTRTQWAASLANLAFSVGILDDDSGGWRDNPPKRLYQVKYKDNISK